MHEGQSQSHDQFSISSSEILKLGTQLDEVVREHQEGGVVDRALAEIEDRYDEAQTDLSRMKHELEKLYQDKVRVDEAIADTLNRLSDLSEADGPDSDIADDRDFILATNLRKLRMEARQLKKSISLLDMRLQSCELYIKNNREYKARLENRPATIKKILGHIAVAVTELGAMPQIEPVPVLFNELYKYESIISDSDTRQVTQLLDNSSEPIISVPITLPPPLPQRAPTVEVSQQQLPLELRRATIPTGSRNIFSQLTIKSDK